MEMASLEPDVIVIEDQEPEREVIYIDDADPNQVTVTVEIHSDGHSLPGPSHQDEDIVIEGLEPGVGPGDGEGVLVIDEDGDEEEEDLGGDFTMTWESLPDLVVAKVASYLKEWDKSQMSLVCKNWKRVVLGAPRLWRHRIMKLRGNFRDRLHVNYANVLGRYLNRLHLSSGIRNIRNVRRFQKNFTTVLAELYRQNVQLEEFSLMELKFHVHFRGTPGGYARQGIIRSARRFLGKQKKLRYLDLNYGGMTTDEGIALLQAASDKSGRSLKALDIEELFRPGEAVHQSSAFAQVLPRFVNLKHLTLNYAALSDGLLQSLARDTSGQLQHFHVRCMRGENVSHTVGTPAWRMFSSAMTKCKLEFSLLGIIRLGDIQRVLSPEMPLHVLSIMGHNDDTFQPDRTLKYLSRYIKDTIEKVIVDVAPCYKMYGRGLIDLVRDCPRLRHLEIRGRLRWHVIHDIFEFLDVNFVRRGVRPTLTTLRMLVTSTPVETYEDEAFVIEEFRQVFSKFELMYELVIEPMFFPLPLEYRQPQRVRN